MRFDPQLNVRTMNFENLQQLKPKRVLVLPEKRFSFFFPWNKNGKEKYEFFLEFFDKAKYC